MGGRRGLGVAVHGTGHGARSYRDVPRPHHPAVEHVHDRSQRRTATSVPASDGTASSGRSTASARAAQRVEPVLGVVGYTLGGGVGVLARQYGFAADHVRSFELVTADGRCRHVSPTSDPDLYWAVLGAPGSFGVVTRLEFDLMRIHRLYAGTSVTGSSRPRRPPLVPRVDSGLPDATTASIAVCPGGPARRSGVVHLRFAHAGRQRDRGGGAVPDARRRPGPGRHRPRHPLPGRRHLRGTPCRPVPAPSHRRVPRRP